MNPRIDVTLCIVSERDEELAPRMLESLADEPVNVHVLREPFSSPRAARVFSFDVGAADYFTFVDPDDEIVPGVFGRIAEVIAAESPPFIGVNEIVRGGGRDQRMSGLIPGRKLLVNALHHLPVYRRDLYSASLWEGVPDGKGCEVVAASRFVAASGRLCYLQDPGYVWVRREGSYSSTPRRRANLGEANALLLEAAPLCSLYANGAVTSFRLGQRS